MPEAYLINPVKRKPLKKKNRGGKSVARKKKSGSRRKLYGAAATAHKKKVASRKRRRKNPCNTYKISKPTYTPNPKKKRKRHSVKPHRRKGGSVKKYYRNPNGFKLPTAVGLQRDLMDGVMAAATLGAAFYASRVIGTQASRFVPGAERGLPNFLVKLGVATATVWVANMVTRDSGLRKVALAGAYFPLAIEGIAMVAPQVAVQMAVVPIMPSPAAAPAAQGVGAYLGMTPGPRLSDYTIDAELEAELEEDVEYGLF